MQIFLPIARRYMGWRYFSGVVRFTRYVVRLGIAMNTLTYRKRRYFLTTYRYLKFDVYKNQPCFLDGLFQYFYTVNSLRVTWFSCQFKSLWMNARWYLTIIEYPSGNKIFALEISVSFFTMLSNNIAHVSVAFIPQSRYTGLVNFSKFRFSIFNAIKSAITWIPMKCVSIVKRRTEKKNTFIERKHTYFNDFRLWNYFDVFISLIALIDLKCNITVHFKTCILYTVKQNLIHLKNT